MWLETGLTIDDLNAMPCEDFVRAIGWVFERSPWVAERAWTLRPFQDLDALHLAMAREVERASPQEQLDLLNAHPDLGTRLKLSDASESEQAGAGLNALPAEEFERFTRLNTSYKDKFGFPFLLAVKGRGKEDILRALEERLKAAREAEFAEALRQVYRIAAVRLHDVLSQEL